MKSIYLDIIHNSEYYSKHPNESPTLGNDYTDKLFSMFVRDSHVGLGYRDLGRKLMKDSDVPSLFIPVVGRYDDLVVIGRPFDYNVLLSECMQNNDLAKKWMPRLRGKYKNLAKNFCKQFKMTEQEYRKLIKCDNTIEYKLSHNDKENIDIEDIPYLARKKYRNIFGEMTNTVYKEKKLLDRQSVKTITKEELDNILSRYKKMVVDKLNIM